MSVAYTEQAVRDRTKTVTRRKGWWVDKNGRHLVKSGDRLTLVRKAMGLKAGEKVVRVAEVEVVSVRREPLCSVAGPYTIDDHCRVVWHELIAEGFPDMSPDEFMRRFFKPQGIGVMDDVTRIEWRYLDGVTQ